jgi:hypothetical protein
MKIHVWTVKNPAHRHGASSIERAIQVGGDIYLWGFMGVFIPALPNGALLVFDVTEWKI